MIVDSGATIIAVDRRRYVDSGCFDNTLLETALRSARPPIGHASPEGLAFGAFNLYPICYICMKYQQTRCLDLGVAGY